jgi:hypothetical protein
MRHRKDRDLAGPAALAFGALLVLIFFLPAIIRFLGG